MAVTADHSADITVFPIGWTWTGAPSAVAGTSNTTGTGVFGFTVYKNVSGPQMMGVDENAALSSKVRYRVVVTNPTTITNFTLPRLYIELQCLSFAATGKLPYIADSFYGSTAPFGTATGASNLIYPKVRSIQYEQEKENDPSVWSVTYTLNADRNAASSTRPGTGDAATKPNMDEAPWTLGPDVTIDFSTEDFVLGLGRFVGAKTPAELNTALAGSTYASLFDVESSVEWDLVKNSANDPLESPPPMKVGTASIRINRAFETLPAGLTASLNAAVEEVCESAVTANGITFAAFTCKLSGATVANKRWRKNCDWLPKQKHPLESTYADVGWTPPTGSLSTNVAVNYTRNVIPAFEYLDYYEVSVTVAQRDLGWGYALIDKGYRDKNHKESGFSGRQSYANVLAEGLFFDTATGTSDKKVLRLYQVHKTGALLDDVLTAMLGA